MTSFQRRLLSRPEVTGGNRGLATPERPAEVLHRRLIKHLLSSTMFTYKCKFEQLVCTIIFQLSDIVDSGIGIS